MRGGTSSPVSVSSEGHRPLSQVQWRVKLAWLLQSPVGTLDMIINTDPSCNGTRDSDMAVTLSQTPSWQQWQHGHPDQYVPSSSMTLGHQHGLWWLTRCQDFTQFWWSCCLGHVWGHGHAVVRVWIYVHGSSYHRHHFLYFIYISIRSCPKTEFQSLVTCWLAFYIWVTTDFQTHIKLRRDQATHIKEHCQWPMSRFLGHITKTEHE